MALLDVQLFNQKTIDKVGAGDALLAIFSLCKFVGADNDISIFLASLSALNQTKVLKITKVFYSQMSY